MCVVHTYISWYRSMLLFIRFASGNYLFAVLIFYDSEDFYYLCFVSILVPPKRLMGLGCVGSRAYLSMSKMATRLICKSEAENVVSKLV